MQEKPKKDLHRRLEALVSDFLRISTIKPAIRPEFREQLGQYPPGWAWEADLEGKLIWCSAEVRKLLGYYPEDLIGKSLVSMMRTPQSTKDLQKALASKQSISNLKVEAINQQGSPSTLLINAIPHQISATQQMTYRGVVQVLEADEYVAQNLVLKIPPSYREDELATPSKLADAWETTPGYSIQDGQITPAASLDPADIPLLPEITDGRLKVPILGQQDSVLGVVEFERQADEPPWTEEDQELVSSITQQLALALQDVRSYQLTQQALDEMRKADQLKTQFLANMSHELRTPLNSIIGFSRVILKGIDGPVTETQKQDLTSIYNAGQHLLGLINNILDFSKIESGKMELSFSEVDVREIIRSVMDTAAGLVKGRPIELSVDLQDNLPLIWADNIRIRQILLNLVSNAIKFTDQGKIGVSAKFDENKDPGELMISVFDSGPGIAPGDQNKLFEPFSQLDASPTRRFGGTGLGLSICRHLVELHEGRIWVESEVGKGSTFFFTIPITRVIPPSKETEQLTRILVVCGDKDALRFHQDVIEKVGCEFHTPSDVSDTIRAVAQLQPELVLMDPTLPDGQGWKLIIELKQKPETRTIPIKVFGLSQNFDTGFDLGIGAVITKPIHRNALESAVKLLVLDDGQEKITLFIDDHTEDLEMGRALIQSMIPGEVRMAASGFEGLVATRQRLPQLVLLNLFMAKADGFRMAEALRIDERTRNTPVILIFPDELTAIQLRQLELWTNHCREKATASTQAIYQNTFEQLFRSQLHDQS